MMFTSFFFLITGLSLAFGCDVNVKTLPDLERRSRLYQSSNYEGFVNDIFLSSDWYNVKEKDVQYIMPDSQTIPSSGSCSTQSPWYLNGTHPDISTLTENPVDITVCMRTTKDVCVGKETLEIRKCNGQIQYLLLSTFVQNSAYCFDPPAVHNIPENEFLATPSDVQIRLLTVRPSVEFINEEPMVKLLCIPSFTGTITDKIVFTSWYVNSVLTFYFGEHGSIIPMTEKELSLTGLGKNITCGVRLASSTKGRLTAMVKSETFFAGIKVLNETLVVKKSSQETDIYFERTIPFGCANSVASCTLDVKMFEPQDCTAKGGLTSKKIAKSELNFCGFSFKGIKQSDASSEDNNRIQKMTIATKDITVQDAALNGIFLLQLNTQHSAGSAIWTNYRLEPVTVIVTDKREYDKKQCLAYNDPHMKTSDGYFYEHQHGGDFIMYRNTAYKIEVQIRTKSCNSIAFCTCAVAIRAGGDIFLMDFCSSNPKDWTKIKMTSCKDGGILLINRVEDTHYKVSTPIGTVISVRIQDVLDSLLLIVQIQMAPKDFNNLEGLCGNFDGNQNNDMRDRKGNPTNDFNMSYNRNYHDKFSSEWRIKQGTDVNYLVHENGCNPDATSWTDEALSLYCVCEDCLAAKANNTEPCKEVKPKSDCFPSQYLDCPREITDITREQCNNWKSRSACTQSSANGRKKRYVKQKNYSKKWKNVIKQRRIKRQTFSESDAEKLCSDTINGHPAFYTVTDATGGFNTSQAISDCIFDTFHAQSDEWVQGYVQSLTDIVDMNMKKDPNYTDTHAEEIKTFWSLSCTANCSRNGICTDQGKCICSEGFGGLDCSIDITAKLSIYGVVENGLCGDGDNCESFEINTFDLVRGFVCRIEIREVFTNRSKMLKSTKLLSGEFVDIFTAQCTLPTERKKRSTANNDTAFAHQYDVSISNDGITFSEEISVYVYNSVCQTAINETDGSVSVYLLKDTCFINGNCYNAKETSAEDICYGCVPSYDQFTWTNMCTTTNGEIVIPIYAIVIVVVVAAAIIIAAIIGCLYCKNKRKSSLSQRSVSPGPEPRKHVLNTKEILGEKALSTTSISLKGVH